MVLALRSRPARPGTGAQEPFTVPGHIANHRVLVPYRPVPSGAERGRAGARGPSTGAVVVPAARGTAHLAKAAALAAASGRSLLALCSGAADAGTAQDLMSDVAGLHEAMAVDVPAGWELPGVSFTADHVFPTAMPGRAGWRHADTATKRNAALVLARLCGWEHVFFMDDDVRGVGPEHLEHADRLLAAGRPAAEAEAVGWAFDEYPDNSIVNHAFRLAGGVQGTFIGAGALAVRVSELTPHFPREYNEDWLFMLPMLLRERSRLVLAGTMLQDPYDPFALSEHAERQEIGDLLAEGLFRLPHRRRDRSVEQAQSSQYWRAVLRDRHRLIEATAARLSARPDADSEVVVRATAALEVARGASRCSELPRALASWVREWRQDCFSWHRFLESRAERWTLSRAVESLGLPGPGTVTRAKAQGWDRRRRVSRRTATAGCRAPSPR